MSPDKTPCGKVYIKANQYIENNTTITHNVLQFDGVAVDTFINYSNGKIKQVSFEDYKDRNNIEHKGGLYHLINYGQIGEKQNNGSDVISLGGTYYDTHKVDNYGYIDGISFDGVLEIYNEGEIYYGVRDINENSGTVIINNAGRIGVISVPNIIIDKYALTINQKQGKLFVAGSWYDGFNCGSDCLKDDVSYYSHILVNTALVDDPKISLKDANSKIILDFGERFELGKKYLLDKIIVDVSAIRTFSVPLSARALKNPDSYEIRQCPEIKL